MILASFSLDWFMTIPGMLITGGVIFLIVALVIFIVTSTKKTKISKEVKDIQEVSKQEATIAATSTIAPTTVTTNNETVATPQSVVTNESVVPATSISSMAEKVVPKEMEPAVFTAPISQNVVSTPQPAFDNEISNIVEQNISAVNPTTVQTTNSVIEPTVSAQSITVPTGSTIEHTPIINQSVVSDIPTKEEKKEVIQTPSADMPRPIYGGVSPIVPNVPHEEEHRPIYGGANPLENTQSVPIVPQRPVVTEDTKVVVPTVEISTVPVTPNVVPTVASQTTNDIFANSPVATTPVAPQTVEPIVAVQSTVSQSQPEEIESLF